MNRLYKAFRKEIIALNNGTLTNKFKGQTLATINEFLRLLRAVTYKTSFESVNFDLKKLLDDNNIKTSLKGIGFKVDYKNL